jgi:esterase/lipase
MKQNAMTKMTINPCVLFFLFIILFNPSVNLANLNSSAPTQQNNVTQQTNWYDDFIFRDPDFAFEFIRTLGYASAGAADLGECVSTARNITDGNIYSWYQQWLYTANRLNNFAASMQAQGDFNSAREAYFRASNYYRTAGLFMVAERDRPKSISAYAMSKQTFLKGISYLPYVKSIKIPYENTTLPGYIVQSTQKNAPLLIVHSGFDGTAEELYFEVGVAAHERGYNVLLFEGPGQGEVIRQQNLPFRPDWEKVVTPVINYALTLPNIDKNKIALMGISMGGYLAARACAFDTRIKACIVNGGIYDVSENTYKSIPANLLALLQSNPGKFNTIMYGQMKKSLITQWFFNNAMWTFAAKSPAEVMKKIKLYSLESVVDKIKSPMLVIDSEADMFYKGQPEQLYGLLKSPKMLLQFTRQEAAQAHCQMGANAISNELIFKWLNKTLKFSPSQIVL